MTWQLWLLISIIALSFNGLFHRSILKNEKSDAKAQTIVFLTLGGAITILIAIFQGNIHFSFPENMIANLLILAVFGSIAYFLKYKGFQVLETSEVILLATTSKFWNVIGGYLFLNESITFQKVLGSIVIIIGIGIATFSNGKFKFNKGLFFVLLSALLFGITDINGYFILQNMDSVSYQIYFYFLPVLAILIMQPKAIAKISYYLNPKNGIKVTLLSIFDVVGMLALFNSYQSGGKASVIGPLSSTKIILTTILATILLNEKRNLINKMLGAIVTFMGVILLL